MIMKDRNISRCVWCAKAFAILTVIFAHSDFQHVRSVWLDIIFQRMGAMGVPLFLLLSAYYYIPSKYTSLWELIKSRLTTFSPWLIFAVACYLWSNLRMGKEINVLSCIQFILGYNSLFYFMTVLILLQFVFYIFRFVNIKIMLVISIIFTIISTEMAALGITDGVLAHIGLTNYLNIFNWIGFFALGLYLQTIEKCKIFHFIKKSFIVFILIWLSLFILGFYIENGQFGYFSMLGIFMETASVVIIMRLAWIACHLDWIVQLGKYSFSIYLVHINIVPIVNKFLGVNAFGEIISPFITYFLSFLLIWLVCRLLKAFKISFISKYLLGVRIE